MTLGAGGGADVWARSAFRLRGSLVPCNGRAIYLRDRQGCRNFTRSKGWERSPTWRQRRASERAARRLETSKSVTMGHIPVARLLWKPQRPQANKKLRPYNGFTACTQRLFPLGVHLARQPEFVAHSPHSSGITPTG